MTSKTSDQKVAPHVPTGGSCPWEHSQERGCDGGCGDLRLLGALLRAKCESRGFLVEEQGLLLWEL